MGTNPRDQQRLGDDGGFYVLRALDVGARLDGYPAVEPDGSAPVFSFDDGPPSKVPFTEVAVVDPAISRTNAVMCFDRLAGQLYLTRQRVVLFCADYDKGERPGCGIGFVGILVVGVMWLARRLRAKQRSKGKVLVGHIFHTDLVEVGGSGDTVVIHSKKPRSDQPVITVVTFSTEETAECVRSTLRGVATTGKSLPGP